MTVKRPALRYHGGKWKLAPWIIQHFPEHRVYDEVYGGGASVLLRKARCYAEIYNDLDGEIVNVFRVLRDPAQARELQRLIALTPYARTEFETSHLVSGDPIEQARRTIFRSFAGHGSTLTGKYTTGFRVYCGDHRRGATPAGEWKSYANQVHVLAERMAGVYIEQRPALDVLAEYDGTKTLHYVDPPYPVGTRGVRHAGKAYRHEMTDDDHRSLAEVLHSLKGFVILSGYACDLYDQELFADWHRVERQTHADRSLDRTEVLWLNPRAAQTAQIRMEVAA